MYSRTPYADEYAQVPTRPSWIFKKLVGTPEDEDRRNLKLTLISFAIGTSLVSLELQ